VDICFPRTWESLWTGFHVLARKTVPLDRVLAPHYFPTGCFGGSSNLKGTGSILFFNRLFWRQLKFGGNWLHIIFWWNVLEIWRELTLHYFPADCFGGSSDLAGTGSTLFSVRLFWRQLKFGGNWLHIIFRRIVLEILIYKFINW
jgi:hypothetical protein